VDFFLDVNLYNLYNKQTEVLSIFFYYFQGYLCRTGNANYCVVNDMADCKLNNKSIATVSWESVMK
jgi:hypothetical protein